MELLTDIWESLSRNKFRTAMTGFAVAWGIFILIVLLGASSGLEHGIEKQWGSRVSNSVEIWAGYTSMPYRGLKEDREIRFTAREANLIREMHGVELFSTVVNTQLTANLGSAYATATVKGIEPDYQHIFHKAVYQGRFLNELDALHREKVCVIDRRLLEELGNPDIVGKYLKLGDISFKVVGVCENGERWQGSTVHIPLNVHQAIFSTDGYFDHITLTLNTDISAADFEQRLRTLLSPILQFDPTDHRAVGVWNQQQAYDNQQGAMRAIRLLVLIIGLCTLVSGAVGVSNIMLVSVRERTKELGIRKAIGAPPMLILRSVVGEALMITLLFGVLGMFLGIGLVELLNMFIPASNDGMGAVFLNPSVNIPSVLLALLIMIIVGVIAGTIPATKAMHIKPIEAMNN